jgi:hypothetical protein
LVKKPRVEGTPQEERDTLIAGAIFAKRTTLAEFLVEGRYETGEVRATPTLMVYVTDSRWQAWLHDREETRACWVAGETLDELLDALEEGLMEDRLPWRKDSGRRR